MSEYFVPLNEAIPIWPTERFPPVSENNDDPLNNIGITDFHIDERRNQTTVHLSVAVKEEIGFEIPGLSGFEVVIAPTGPSMSEVNAQIDLRQPFEVRLVDVNLSLRMDSTLVSPVERDSSSDEWVVKTNGGRRAPFEIELGNLDIIVNGDGDIGFTSLPEVTVDPFMISDTGFVVESTKPIGLYLSRISESPNDKPTAWRGVHIEDAAIYPPELEFDQAPDELSLEDCYFGSGGFEGSFSSQWDPGEVVCRLFGMEFDLHSVEIDFTQSVPTRGGIGGDITLPFFDQPVGVAVSVGAGGEFGLALSEAQPDGVEYQDGILNFQIPDIVQVTLDTLWFETEGSGFELGLSGSVKPLIADDWPEIPVPELIIDEDGNVRCGGGWITLPDQYSIDFYGFLFEITKLGFGKNDDGTKWIGLDGSIKFTDEITAGASVDGMRITWGDGAPSISFEGIGVEFEVPDVVRFDGEVAFEDVDDGQQFVGDIELELIALEFTIDAKLVIGQTSDPQGEYIYCAIYVGAELPAGIPLFSTGLSLYGMAGLQALNYEPDKRDNEKWYAVDESNSYYHRGESGVTDIVDKWRPQRGSLALGAGVTIGTTGDNGYSFSGRLLLAIVFPGPIIMFQGKANLLKERAELSSGEPNFGALAVLDNREGSIQLGLDAQYMFDEESALIDISGRAEAYYDFHDPMAWYINLGKRDPRDQRIRASYLGIFEANAYFMLNPDRLALGAWQGFDAGFDFGPLGVDLEAWIEGNALLNFNPAHFYADLWLHGKVALRAFGFKLGINVDATLAADVFDPFHILGDFSVSLPVPWPFEDPTATVTVEWGPTLDPPTIPNPLKEVALEHERSTATWRLPREQSPDPEGGDTYPALLVPSESASQEPPDKLPVVPPDARPQLNFNRSVHDGSSIVDEDAEGWNAQKVTPEYEQIGNPSTGEGPVKVKYSLSNILLERWEKGANSWETAGDIYGSWAPLPRLPQSGTESLGKERPAVGNTRLTLFSRNPFETFRNSGGDLGDDLIDRLNDYPCPSGKVCFDYNQLPSWQLETNHYRDDLLGTIFGGTYTIKRYKISGWNWISVWPTVEYSYNPEAEMGELPKLIQAGEDQFLHCEVRRTNFPPDAENETQHWHSLTVRIELPQPVQSVSIDHSAKIGDIVLITESDSRFQKEINSFGYDTYTTEGDKIAEIEIRSKTQVSREDPSHPIDIFEICGADYPLELEQDPRVDAMQGSIDRLSDSGKVLEPHTTYRLAIDTVAHAIGEPGFEWDEKFERTEYAYFRTGSAPGIGKYTTPIGTPDATEFESGLDDLSRYVAETVPESAQGIHRDLPRPIYRGYDVTVDFNASYVDQFYRMGKRDLTILLFDNNGVPVRTADGPLFIAEGQWGTVEHTPTEADQQLKEVIEKSSCLSLSAALPEDDTIQAGGFLLAPDTLYDAVLRPVLLYDTFANSGGWIEQGGDWEVSSHEAFNGAQAVKSGPHEITLDSVPTGLLPGHDTIQIEDDQARRTKRYRIDAINGPTITLDGDPSFSGASQWTIPAHSLTTVTSVPSDDFAIYEFGGIDNLPDGDRDQPEQWTDCRIETRIDSSDSATTIGVEVRRTNDGSYRYLVAPDGTRSLVAVDSSGTEELAAAEGDRPSSESYRIVVEAIDDTLRVYEPDGIVLSATDTRFTSGTVAVVADSENATVTSVRVDDFRAGSPDVYRFSFSSSAFATFRHQLHSYQDESWSAILPTGTDLPTVNPSGLGSGSNIPPSPPTPAEIDAYETVIADIPDLPLDSIEVSRIDEERATGSTQPRALLIRSPEPIDWSRTHIDLKRASTGTVLETPGRVKMTEADISNEAVVLLVRNGTDLSGWRVEQEQPSSSVQGPILLDEQFKEGLEEWTFVDEPPYTIRESDWQIEDGSLHQRSNIYGFVGGQYNQPGTFGVTGDQTWTDYNLTVDLWSGDDDAIGVLFRYNDPNNFYRFSMDAERGYRRLVKRSNGRTTLLWHDDDPFVPGESQTFTVQCAGGTLTGQLDGEKLFELYDDSHLSGTVGVYCRANINARFDRIQVQSVGTEWKPYHEFVDGEVFQDGTEIVVTDGTPDESSPDVEYRQRNGSVNLNDNRATLRLIAPDGEVSHQREFRAKNEYHSVTPRVLRNADGTGLIVSAGSGLPTGQYRIIFTYRRAGRPDRPRGGDLGVERAVLDIPWEVNS